MAAHKAKHRFSRRRTQEEEPAGTKTESAICFDRYSQEYARAVFGVGKKTAMMFHALGVGHTYLNIRLTFNNILEPTISCYSAALDCYDDGTCTDLYQHLGCEAVVKYAREFKKFHTCAIDGIMKRWAEFSSVFEPRVIEIATGEKVDAVFKPKLSQKIAEEAVGQISQYASKHATLFVPKAKAEAGKRKRSFETIPAFREFKEFMETKIGHWHDGSVNNPDNEIVLDLRRLLNKYASACAEKLAGVSVQEIRETIATKCRAETDLLVRNFLLNIAGTDPEILLKCIPTIKSYNALRCFPTLESSVGYYGALHKDEEHTNQGKEVCDKHESLGRITVHPAIIRKSVESLLNSFQGRNLDIGLAAPSYALLDAKRLVSTASTPAICFDHSSHAMCWMFTRCAKIHAKYLDSIITID